MLLSSTGYCTQCNKQVLINKKGVNHILHLILTILTLGWWLIIWILLSISWGDWKCSQCGFGVINRSIKK